MFLGLMAGAPLWALDTQPGADPGPGIPDCKAESKADSGWFALFDGTQASLEKYWFKSNASHGDGGKWWVENNLLKSNQNPGGNGGLLYTHRKYSNVEVKVDIKPDWENDGGLFLHSNGKGSAYQVVIDYKKGKTIGGIYGEKIYTINYKPFFLESPTQIRINFWKEKTPWTTIWDANGFNEIHAKIFEGNPPRIVNYINGYESVDYKAPQQATELKNDGYIGLQIHGGTKSWGGGANEYKSVKVRELTNKGEPVIDPAWSNACMTSTTLSANQEKPSSHFRSFAEIGNRIRITGWAEEKYELQVTNVTGRILYSTRGQTGAINHVVPMDRQGMYLVTLKGRNFHRNAKVLAKHISGLGN